MTLDYKVFADKSAKILLCLLLVLSLIFVQPKENMQSAEAALPAILVTVLGSVILDIAIDMGFEFIDKKAGKAWAENVVGKLWNKYGKKIADLKPTKTKAGKWTLKIAKDLLLLITDEIVDSGKTVKKKDVERKKKNIDVDIDGNKHSYKIDVDVEDPFYKTDINIKDVLPATTSTGDRRMSAFFNEWVEYEFTPVSFAQVTRLKMSSGGYSQTNVLQGNSDITMKLDSINKIVVWSSSQTDSNRACNSTPSSNGVYDCGYGSSYVTTLMNGAYPAFEKYLTLLEQQNKMVYQADGILVTDGFEAYIDLPDDKVVSQSSLDKIDYSKLPAPYQNGKDFEFEISDPTVIDAEFEVINEGDDFEWEIIEQDIVNKGDTIYKTYNYDYEPTINNYYQITPAQKEEIDIIIDTDIDITNPPSTGGKTDIDIEVEGFKYCVDKVGAMVVSCKDIEGVDGSLLEYIKNSYDYAVNAVKAGADGVKTIVAGSAGLLTLYSEVFDWLPDEATTILTSGLLLMIGLRVFRK